MTIGDALAIAAIAFAICLYRYIELKYSRIGRPDLNGARGEAPEVSDDRSVSTQSLRCGEP